MPKIRRHRGSSRQNLRFSQAPQILRGGLGCSASLANDARADKIPRIFLSIISRYNTVEAAVIPCSLAALEHFMNSIIATALSGLDAARKRLEVSAANVANVDSDGALPEASGDGEAPQPYTPLRVSQQPLVT